MEREVLQGEITSPIDPAPGCRFAGRCKYTTVDCTAGEIPLRDISNNHFVACSQVESATH